MNNNTLVDENNQEVSFGTVVHCLGALFKSPVPDLIMLVGKLMMTLIMPIQNIFID